MSLAIHPQTRVGSLLDAYPGIEDALIEWVPVFAKLRNPVLRKTVAKVATLEQAAAIAAVPVRDLILFLRERTGQSSTTLAESESLRAQEISLGHAETQDADIPPDWLKDFTELSAVDADAMLAAGSHPLGVIQTRLRSMKPGHYLRLTSSFHPAPLFDAMRAHGVEVYSRLAGPDRHETFLVPGVFLEPKGN